MTAPEVIATLRRAAAVLAELGLSASIHVSSWDEAAVLEVARAAGVEPTTFFYAMDSTVIVQVDLTQRDFSRSEGAPLVTVAARSRAATDAEARGER